MDLLLGRVRTKKEFLGLFLHRMIDWQLPNPGCEAIGCCSQIFTRFHIQDELNFALKQVGCSKVEAQRFSKGLIREF